MKNCHFTSNKWLYQKYPLDILMGSHVQRWKMSVECIFMIPQLHVGTFLFLDTPLLCKTVILPSNPVRMRQYQKYPLDILMVSLAQRWKMSVECIFMNPELHDGTFLFLDTPLPCKSVILPSKPLRMRQYQKYPLDISRVSLVRRWKMSVECIFMIPQLHVGTFLFLNTPLPCKTVILPINESTIWVLRWWCLH
jgi:hypothetical protein